MANYEVHLMDPQGHLLDIIDEWLDLSYDRVVDAIGTLTLILPGNFKGRSLLKDDGRLAVYREGKLDGESAWLIREIEPLTNTQGTEEISVVAYSGVYLLDSRVIAYQPGTAQASKTDNADSMMFSIVSENLGSAATNSDRDVSTHMSIQASASRGPTMDKEFAWDNVLDVLREIAQTRIEVGSPVHFDVVSPTRSTFEFRTYIGQRGTDHTSGSGISPVTLSLERKNMAAPVRRNFDRADEITYAYAGGTGADSASPESASDGARIAISPFNRREIFVQAGGTSGSAGLQDEARTAVRAGRPRRVFEGVMIDYPGTQYGIHWGFGDKVTAEYRGETFDCAIDAISISYSQGKETITSRLRAED